MDGLSVRSVSKSFGSGRVVDGVSFDVQQGELLTLLGPSGCGKTTTLRLIAGLEQLEGGEILLGDRVLQRARAADSGPARKAFDGYGVPELRGLAAHDRVPECCLPSENEEGPAP